MTRAAASGDWVAAGRRFADYWGGAGTWDAMSAERRAAFAGSLTPNLHEWDAVMDATPLQDWRRILPRDTVVVSTEHSARPGQSAGGVSR